MSDYILLSISILSNGLYNAVMKLLGRKSDGSLRGTMRVNAAIYAVISVVVGAGGTVVATGTPEEVAECEKSYTGQYLKKMLEK